MKAHYRFLTRCLALLTVTAMLSSVSLTGCRKKSGAGETITRAELDKIQKAKGRSDSLTSALETAFGHKGYTFSVVYSSKGSDTSSVETLLRGPASLHVNGARTLDEAIDLDRDLQQVLSGEELAEIKVFYTIPQESMGGANVLYGASDLVRYSEFLSEIKRRKQGEVEQATTSPAVEAEIGNKPQPEVEGNSQSPR